MRLESAKWRSQAFAPHLLPDVSHELLPRSDWLQLDLHSSSFFLKPLQGIVAQCSFILGILSSFLNLRVFSRWPRPDLHLFKWNHFFVEVIAFRSYVSKCLNTRRCLQHFTDLRLMFNSHDQVWECWQSKCSRRYFQRLNVHWQQVMNEPKLRLSFGRRFLAEAYTESDLQGKVFLIIFVDIDGRVWSYL